MKGIGPGLMEIHTAVLLFGFSGLFGKFLALSSHALVFGRTVFAAAALVMFIYASGKTVRIRRISDLFLFLILGSLLAIHWTTFFYSIKISTVAVGLLSYSTFPVFTTCLEPLFFKEKFRGFDILTALFIVFGLWIMVSRSSIEGDVMQGVLWGGLSGFSFAALSLLNRKWVQNYPPVLIAFYQNLFAALILLPFISFGSISFTAKNIILVAVLGIGFTAFAHALFIRSLTFVKVQLAGIIAALEPVYGTLFAFFLLGEVPRMTTIIGGSIIVCTVVFAMVKREKMKPQKERSV